MGEPTANGVQQRKSTAATGGASRPGMPEKVPSALESEWQAYDNPPNRIWLSMC
jgi:hypothetical protein